jgi:hypothetical protein
MRQKREKAREIEKEWRSLQCSNGGDKRWRRRDGRRGRGWASWRVEGRQEAEAGRCGRVAAGRVR